MKLHKIDLILALLKGYTLLGHAVFAQAPLQFTYQGRLTNSNGVPVATSVTGIFQVVKGGDATSAIVLPALVVHSETNVITPDVNGTFSHVLGTQPGTPITLSAIADGNTSRWISVSLDDAELLPRQQIVSVPYAIQAIVADLPGTIKLFAGANIPAGWHLCHGQSLDRLAYAPLFETIGTNFGFANASTFRVPDMRGRVPMGSGQGSGLSNRVLAETLGSQTHTQTVANMPSHNHGGSTTGVDNQDGTDWPRDFLGSGALIRWSTTGAQAGSRYFLAHTHGINSQGDGQPHNIIQPSLVLNYIIKD